MSKERLTIYGGNGEHYEGLDPIDTPYEYGKINLQRLIDKLAYYEDLEEQGLLLRLPCKLGDDLYWIASEDEDGNEKPTIRKYENRIKHITITENGIWVNAEDEAPTELDILGGEYALLTYAEAEEKLRELEGK